MIGKTYSFCPLCGDKLSQRHIELEGKTRFACVSCEFIYYQNPTPAAGVIVVKDGAVLLVQRKFAPRIGGWTLPAGFVESGERVDDCAVREAKEETSLDLEIIRLFNVYSALDDPRSAVVLVLYLCQEISGKLRAGDDASDARFFPLDALPDDIAFKAHVEALRDITDQFADGTLF